MRVIIVENAEHTNHGLVGSALAEQGADIDVVRPFAGDRLPVDCRGHDALVVFGGEQNARADDTHPYLPDLAGLMRAFAEADKAVLGICLGSRILARAFGARNLIGTAPEFGWRQIVRTPHGETDPVIAAVADADDFMAFQWHDDTFTLPPGAVHLASSDAVSHQAFRVGRAAYGMQFHFEAGTEVVEQWGRLFPAQIARKRPDWSEYHASHVGSHGRAADIAGLAIARAWVARINENPAARDRPAGCL